MDTEGSALLRLLGILDKAKDVADNVPKPGSPESATPRMDVLKASAKLAPAIILQSFTLGTLRKGKISENTSYTDLIERMKYDHLGVMQITPSTYTERTLYQWH